MKKGKKKEMKTEQIVKIVTELKTLKCFGFRTRTVFCCWAISHQTESEILFIWKCSYKNYWTVQKTMKIVMTSYR